MAAEFRFSVAVSTGPPCCLVTAHGRFERPRASPPLRSKLSFPPLLMPWSLPDYRLPPAQRLYIKASVSDFLIGPITSNPLPASSNGRRSGSECNAWSMNYIASRPCRIVVNLVDHFGTARKALVPYTSPLLRSRPLGIKPGTARARMARPDTWRSSSVLPTVVRVA